MLVKQLLRVTFFSPCVYPLNPFDRELTQEQPSIPWYSCVRRPAVVTTITVKGAAHLQAQTAFGGECATQKRKHRYMAVNRGGCNCNNGRSQYS